MNDSKWILRKIEGDDKYEPIVVALLDEFYECDMKELLTSEDTWYGNTKFDLNVYDSNDMRSVALYPVVWKEERQNYYTNCDALLYWADLSVSEDWLLVTSAELVWRNGHENHTKINTG